MTSDDLPEGPCCIDPGSDDDIITTPTNTAYFDCDCGGYQEFVYPGEWYHIENPSERYKVAQLFKMRDRVKELEAELEQAKEEFKEFLFTCYVVEEQQRHNLNEAEALAAQMAETLRRWDEDAKYDNHHGCVDEDTNCGACEQMGEAIDAYDKRGGEKQPEPKPDLIYFPWPSGIDGIIGIIGPRGDIPSQVKFTNYERNGDVGRDFIIYDGPFSQRSFDEDGKTVTFRFPADADLTWVRDESEVPEELLRESKEREA